MQEMKIQREIDLTLPNGNTIPESLQALTSEEKNAQLIVDIVNGDLGESNSVYVEQIHDNKWVIKFGNIRNYEVNIDLKSLQLEDILTPPVLGMLDLNSKNYKFNHKMPGQDIQGNKFDNRPDALAIYPGMIHSIEAKLWRPGSNITLEEQLETAENQHYTTFKNAIHSDSNFSPYSSEFYKNPMMFKTTLVMTKKLVYNLENIAIFENVYKQHLTVEEILKKYDIYLETEIVRYTGDESKPFEVLSKDMVLPRFNKQFINTTIDLELAYDSESRHGDPEYAISNTRPKRDLHDPEHFEMVKGMCDTVGQELTDKVYKYGGRGQVKIFAEIEKTVDVKLENGGHFVGSNSMTIGEGQHLTEGFYIISLVLSDILFEKKQMITTKTFKAMKLFEKNHKQMQIFKDKLLKWVDKFNIDELEDRIAWWAKNNPLTAVITIDTKEEILKMIGTSNTSKPQNKNDLVLFPYIDEITTLFNHMIDENHTVDGKKVFLTSPSQTAKGNTADKLFETSIVSFLAFVEQTNNWFGAEMKLDYKHTFTSVLDWNKNVNLNAKNTDRYFKDNFVRVVDGSYENKTLEIKNEILELEKQREQFKNNKTMIMAIEAGLEVANKQLQDLNIKYSTDFIDLETNKNKITFYLNLINAYNEFITDDDQLNKIYNLLNLSNNDINSSHLAWGRFSSLFIHLMTGNVSSDSKLWERQFVVELMSDAISVLEQGQKIYVNAHNNKMDYLKTFRGNAYVFDTRKRAKTSTGFKFVENKNEIRELLGSKFATKILKLQNKIKKIKDDID